MVWRIICSLTLLCFIRVAGKSRGNLAKSGYFLHDRNPRGWDLAVRLLSEGMCNVIKRCCRKLAIMLVALLYPLAALAESVTLTAVSRNPKTQAWKVQFSSHSPVKIHHFTLSNPERLVIDVTGAAAFLNRVGQNSLKSSPIKKIRSFAPSAQALRIVLDLKSGTTSDMLQLLFQSAANQGASG